MFLTINPVLEGQPKVPAGSQPPSICGVNRGSCVPPVTSTVATGKQWRAKTNKQPATLSNTTESGLERAAKMVRQKQLQADTSDLSKGLITEAFYNFTSF